MGNVYEHAFEVIAAEGARFPEENESSAPVGRHLDGCRIGFDAGGSDRKVAAVIDGKEVFSCEVVWEPKINGDPQYHFDGIDDSIRRAAEHLPRIDAIGVSSAGVYIDNKTRVASLFRKIPPDLFERRIKTLYLDIAKKWGDVPVEVANDGDVTALAGAMSLDDQPVLGLAMGTSQAVGYVDEKGYITGWLNELAFAPVDYAVERSGRSRVVGRSRNRRQLLLARRRDPAGSAGRHRAHRKTRARATSSRSCRSTWPRVTPGLAESSSRSASTSATGSCSTPTSTG